MYININQECYIKINPENRFMSYHFVDNRLDLSNKTKLSYINVPTTVSYSKSDNNWTYISYQERIREHVPKPLKASSNTEKEKKSLSINLIVNSSGTVEIANVTLYNANNKYLISYQERSFKVIINDQKTDLNYFINEELTSNLLVMALTSLINRIELFNGLPKITSNGLVIPTIKRFKEFETFLLALLEGMSEDRREPDKTTINDFLTNYTTPNQNSTQRIRKDKNVY